MSILKKVIKAVTKIFKATLKPKRKRKSPSSRLVKSRKVVPTRRAKASIAKPKKSEPIRRKRVKKAVASKRPMKAAGASKTSPVQKSTPASIGEVTHYFDRIKVCVIRIDREHIKKGDVIQLRGAKGELTQQVASMQIENEDVTMGKKGQLIGLKVSKPVYVKDQVYKVPV